jgi:thiol-disulfide isomerase/thioredoxin
MSKPKRTQRSTGGSRPAGSGAKTTNSSAGGAARSTARANGTAAVGVTARPATTVSSTRPQTRAGASSVRPSTTSSSTRIQARTAYAKNRRRSAPVPWWKTSWARIGGPIVLVLLVVGIFVYVSTHGGASTGTNRQPVPEAVLHGVTSVSPATFASIGTGEVANPFVATGGSSGSPKVPILRDSSGKPIFLYVGAEYCPYCAAERWAMVIALSRFGTFSNLHIISSSSTDSYPNTPTFTFYKSTYTSPYIDFQPVEVQDRNSNRLETMSSAQSLIFNKYNTSQSYPFMDFGNQYIAIGASYQNNVLTDQDWQSIAQLLNNPNSNVTQSIVGTANYMTAAICQITGNKPANVCTAAPIPAIEKTIGKPAGS